MMTTKSQEHLNLLCDIGELAALLSGSENIDNFFQRAVDMVARHMKVGICSIYLLDEESNELVLKASVGLNPEAVGKIRLKPGEGLVGITLERQKPVKEDRAGRHPGYGYSEKAGEVSFESFLAVPVRRGAERIGVLAVQHPTRDYFDDMDVLAMRAIASQLAGAVGNARLLIGHAGKAADSRHVDSICETVGRFSGQIASGGFAFAPSTVFDKSHGLLISSEVESDSEYTLTDFRRAVRDTENQIQELQSRFAQRLIEGVSLIFTAHLMILKDVRFTSEMEKLIRDGESAPIAVKTVANHYINLFESSGYGHIREKANDVKDLAGRILENLQFGVRDGRLLSENRIVIAPELYPSDVLRLACQGTQGIVLVGGGVTSHVAIIARSLEIPLMILNEPELLQIPDGTPMIINGESGIVHVQPTEEDIRQFNNQKESALDIPALALKMAPATYTRDGICTRLLANINLLGDLPLAKKFKAEGVGLYRTEFPFLIRSAVLSEEEQYQIYKRLFDEMTGKEVTIRVLDIGSDKLPAYTGTANEANPALGLRAMRFLFHHGDIFHQQLRAILRAAAEFENPRIMFPMISSLDELRKARQTVYDCMAELEREGLPYHPEPMTGALIELPCLVEIIDELAAEADFLSIGTNDFIQYMLGVDRTNEKVAEYFQPYHPAVVRSLAKIVHAAQYRNKEISVCGELAHDPDYIPFLLGIGIRKLSVYPKFLPSVQKVVSNLKIPDAEIYAERLLEENSLKGARQVLLGSTSKICFN